MGADESSLMLEGLEAPLQAWGSPLPFARENWLIVGTGEESERNLPMTMVSYTHPRISRPWFIF
ncbi:MAG: hypothetical protein HQL77_17700 [Magnetococcales bacterium]|nr:hypothetical protein [Magnetococcales bacterium]